MVQLAPASGIGATSAELANSRKTIAENFDTFFVDFDHAAEKPKPVGSARYQPVHSANGAVHRR